MTPTLVLFALLCAPQPAPVAPIASDTVDRVAALVDGQVVLLSDIVDRAGAEWRRVQAMPEGPAREEKRREVLRKAFDLVLADRLLSIAAAQDQVEASEQQVDSAIQDIKTRNNLDDGALKSAVEAQGIDMPTFRQQVKRDLDAYMVLDHRVRSRVKVTDEDVQNYYQTHDKEFAGERELHVRHIFLPLPENASPATVEQVTAEAERVRARLLAGADFAAEAVKVSKGPSAAQGGDLGWLRKGTIQKALEDAAFALNLGQISPVVRVGPGVHILTVDAQRLGGAKTFEEAKEEVRNRLYQQQVESYRGQLISDLKKEALIELKMPELSS